LGVSHSMWVRRNRGSLGLLLDLAKVDKLLNTKEGKWRDVEQELLSCTKTSLGMELFGSPLASVVEEKADALISEKACKFFEESKNITSEGLEKAMSDCVAEISAMSAIDTLKQRRQVQGCTQGFHFYKFLYILIIVYVLCWKVFDFL